MKKRALIFTIVFGGLISSCSQEVSMETTANTQEKDLTASASDELTLNKGEKWGANLETYQGMQEINKLLSDFDGQALEDYHALGNKSDEQTVFIISNCSMKGEAHDQLHLVLLPILENKDMLKSAESIELAEEEFSKLEENIDIFFKFFKN